MEWLQEDYQLMEGESNQNYLCARSKIGPLRLCIDPLQVRRAQTHAGRDEAGPGKRRLGHAFLSVDSGLRKDVDQLVRHYTAQCTAEQQVRLREVPTGHRRAG